MAVQGDSKNTYNLLLLFEEILFLKAGVGWRIIYQIELNGLVDKDEVIVYRLKLASQNFYYLLNELYSDKMNVHYIKD